VKAPHIVTSVDDLRELGSGMVVVADTCKTRESLCFNYGEISKREIGSELKRGATFGNIVAMALFHAIEMQCREQGLSEQLRLNELKNLADKRGIKIVYGDVDITEIIKQFWRRLSIREKMTFIRKIRKIVLTKSPPKLGNGAPMTHIVSIMRSVCEKKADDVQVLRAKKIMNEAEKVSDKGSVVIFCDEHLARKIKEVSKGCAPNPMYVKQKRPILARILKILIPTLFAAYLIMKIITRPRVEIAEILVVWAIITVLFSTVASIPAKPHPKSLVLIALLAPFMSMILIGSGWAGGFMELRVRKPTLGDFFSLSRAENLRAIMYNNVMRPFFVGLFANTGNMMAIILLLKYIV